MYYCDRCDYRRFVSAGALHAHYRDRDDHPYCGDCQTLFGSFDVLDDHMYHEHASYEHASYEHASYDAYSQDEQSEDDDVFCYPCDCRFRDLTDYYQHLAASSKHNWCFVCSRDFSSPNALAQHSSSQVHRPRDIKCPLCSETFKAVSSIAQHVESGACRSGINRHTVTRAIHSLDLVPNISIDRRITGPGGDTPTITNWSATELAFNGIAYECYLCHRTFNTLNSLNAHLNSPAHDSMEFRCPRCCRQYTLISGLVQHIESEVCGIAKFEGVRRQLEGVTNGFQRMLTMY